jgi:Phage integrase, N-terminal SAM-like domain
VTPRTASPIAAAVASPEQPPRILDRLRDVARERGASAASVDNLVGWARAYILFHDKRHPRDMGLEQAAHFLEHVVKSTANPLPALAQARSALMVLYDEVLGIPLGELPQPRPPRLLDQLRLVLRVRHYSRRTEDCYANWARRFILFHRKRHPRTMGAAEVELFLTHLAVQGGISASSAARDVFLYNERLEVKSDRRCSHAQREARCPDTPLRSRLRRSKRI